MLAPAKLEDAETVRIGAQQVRYVRRKGAEAAPGDAPILVLHGWGAHLEAVGAILGALEGSDLVALDLPGFGESDPPPKAWNAGDYARFVTEFLDELGIESAHLVGHSHGGRVAIVLATDERERVERLLLVDAAGIRPKRTWRYRRRVAVAKLGRVVAAVGGPPGKRLQERMRARVASRDYLEASETMRGTFRAVIAEDLTDRLPRISAPTLLVWGDRDEDTPLWMAHRMEELIPDAGLVVLEGAGHYSYADSPGRFAAVARRFLVEQPREAAAQKAGERGARAPEPGGRA
jgi:pimeloyl-ACP methyl ester carboxylesterase